MSKFHKLPVTLTKHHRKPKSLGGTNAKENISVVPDHHHRAWHLLFRQGDPEYVAMVINRTWIDPEYKIVVVKKGK